MLASSRGFITLLRSYDAWHIDLSSSYSTQQCSGLEKDSKNVSHVPDSRVWWRKLVQIPQEGAEKPV